VIEKGIKDLPTPGEYENKVYLERERDPKKPFIRFNSPQGIHRTSGGGIKDILKPDPLKPANDLLERLKTQQPPQQNQDNTQNSGNEQPQQKPTDNSQAEQETADSGEGSSNANA
jgi:hypothetical protein